MTAQAPPQLSAREMTRQLNERLHAHFISEEDRRSSAGAGAVYLTEVTAPGGTRRADAVHVGLWQNRGPGRIDVCELKVSREDWRRELDNPRKAEAWWPYCRAFWLVVPFEGIVKDGELPPGWGLMMPKAAGRRFRVLVKPTERADGDFKLTIPLLVTLLKCTETARTNALDAQRTQMLRDFRETGQKIRRDSGQLSREDRRRLEQVVLLEQAMGKKLDDVPWGDDRISPMVAAGALRDHVAGHAALEKARGLAAGMIRDLERVAEEAKAQADLLRGGLNDRT